MNKSTRNLSKKWHLAIILATAPIIADAETSLTTFEEGHLSTLQVIEKVKKENKGRIIKAERKATSSHPNCHHVKMKTSSGEFKLIKEGCS